MARIAENIMLLRQQIPVSVEVVAVSKKKSAEEILELYNSGHRAFGENRVQELLKKKEILPRDIEWHLIGHLQGNKVKYIVPFISMIQSVDSLKLLTAINAEASTASRIIPCLLQIYIASEETKSGFDADELLSMLENLNLRSLTHVKICGVMGMATFTDDLEQVRREFRSLADIFKLLKNRYFPGEDHFKEISMGMSGDFRIAIEEGSTIVRIGTLIFGDRK
ncbi:MAG: YggS family pyridoxal phosphate-dependent enzyme [Bacteroidales bacterium]